MSVVEWSDEISVGIPSLDADHRGLLTTLKDMETAIAKGAKAAEVAKIFARMRDYAGSHFRREEEAMWRLDYPGFEAHKATHDHFAAWIADMAHRLETEPDTISLEELLARLSVWWSLHVAVADKDYAKFFVGREALAARILAEIP